MRILSFETIRDLGIRPRTCYQWVEEAFTIKAETLLPKKISLAPPGLSHVFYNTMPCVVPPIDRAGVKVVTRYPDRNPALDSEILLYELETGDCLALMDGDWITTMRTGAVAAHSIDLFGRPGFERVAIVGLGNTARASLLCLLDANRDKHFEVGLLEYKDQHVKFRERFSNFENVTFHDFSDVKALAHWCEVFLSCVTATDDDLVSPDDFAPGTLVVPVHTRGFRQCDLVFDKVFCDDEAHVSGFGYYPEFKARLAEVASVASGQKPGRTDDEERILAYNIGIALHDVFFADKIERLSRSSHVPQVSLQKSNEKFWA